MKYVVLEHLIGNYKGHRFWSINSDNNTHLYDGTLAYKVIGFTDSTEDAIKMCEIF